MQVLTEDKSTINRFIFFAKFSMELFKGKRTQPNEYPKEPYPFAESRFITEDEKQREVDKFFAQESARRANWKRTHKK